MDKETKKIELLKAKINYSKTYAIGFMNALVITGFYLVLLDKQDYWTLKHYILLIFLYLFTYGFGHFYFKHDCRQRDLVEKLK